LRGKNRERNKVFLRSIAVCKSTTKSTVTDKAPEAKQEAQRKEEMPTQNNQDIYPLKLHILTSPSSLPETILSSPRPMQVTAPRCPNKVAVHLPSSRLHTCRSRRFQRKPTPKKPNSSDLDRTIVACGDKPELIARYTPYTLNVSE
jgi:hypothetical protein